MSTPGSCEIAQFTISDGHLAHTVCGFNRGDEAKVFSVARANITFVSSGRGWWRFRFRYYVTQWDSWSERCGLSEFQCGKRCLPYDWVCNGVQECENGNDEESRWCPSQSAFSISYPRCSLHSTIVFLPDTPTPSPEFQVTSVEPEYYETAPNSEQCHYGLFPCFKLGNLVVSSL